MAFSFVWRRSAICPQAALDFVVPWIICDTHLLRLLICPCELFPGWRENVGCVCVIQVQYVTVSSPDCSAILFFLEKKKKERKEKELVTWMWSVGILSTAGEDTAQCSRCTAVWRSLKKLNRTTAQAATSRT
jgi:hypothetical protein